MSRRVYIYQGCDTCRKAKKWLAEHEVEAEFIPIRDQPPTQAELKRMLEQVDGQLRKLFNVSSKDYREAGLKDRIGDMKPTEAFKLLRANGNLVKRPFLIDDAGGLVGFKPEVWSDYFG